MNFYIKTATEAAREAGKIQMAHYGKIAAADIRKKAASDFLSFVDEQSEKIILEVIKDSFPDHSILAEEGGVSGQQSDYQWIIDPLDGTTNYLKNIPVFAVSIALQKGNELIAGVVFDPVHNDLYHAEKGKGAYLNNLPIKVSSTARLNESFISTGFPFKIKHILHDFCLAFEKIFQQCIGARRLGAAAIDLAYVASGRFDGFWEMGLKPWDVAAGALLVIEAGGEISDFWNNPSFLHSSFVMATNSKIHTELGEIIREVFPFYKPILEGAQE